MKERLASLGARAKTVFAGVGAVTLLAALSSRGSRGKPKVPDGVVLHLDMAAMPLVEGTPPPLAALLSKSPPVSLRSIVSAIEEAAKDSRVKGIVCTYGNDSSPPLAQV
jgi:hypothetical protein